MTKMKKIAPSILSADFTRLGEEVRKIEEAGADYLHIDVMDGRFVPNITVGPAVVKTLSRATRLPLDVHLMVEEPERYLDTFAAAGSHIITIHAEGCRHLHRGIQRIKELGALPGVALNPATPLSILDHVLPELSLVVIMTVNPGFGGQEFIPASLAKIASLRRLIDEAALPIEIQVDGGVNLDNIAEVAKAGCDIFVSGSGIFNQESYSDTISKMRKIIGA